MKLTRIVKRAAGHYTARTAAGTFTITRTGTGRTWHLVGRRITAAYRTLRAAVAALKQLRPTPLGGMPTRLTKVIARTHQAARTTTKALNYRCLSGNIAVAVDAGTLIRTGDMLERLGADELKDGYKSWYGKFVKKAYIAANGHPPVMVWAQHRTTGRWIHVAAYSPLNRALFIGLASYKQTRHLIQADFMEVA
ncbi:hypothetical protein [Streptomyces sp. NPDC058629]|uniref:hypothetical protein n=1 Tax=Streptomyces sp. NPDC058629 TaxID=3346565 RepID=UPI00365F6E12